MQAPTMLGSALNAARVSVAACGSLKASAAVLLLPMISASVVNPCVVWFRNASRSYTTNDPHARMSAAQVVSNTTSVSLRLKDMSLKRFMSFTGKLAMGTDSPGQAQELGADLQARSFRCRFINF